MEKVKLNVWFLNRNDEKMIAIYTVDSDDAIEYATRASQKGMVVANYFIPGHRILEFEVEK